MFMKTYLLETFLYNDTANKKLLDKISLLTDKQECVKLFSHLVNCQYKWMARIKQDADARQMSWWEPVYDLDSLAEEWSKSLKIWTDFITEKTDEELSAEIAFTGFDDTVWAASTKDIALQLNYHSIHHRAQMQTLIRQQGIEPDFIDYIGTKYRKIG